MDPHIVFDCEKVLPNRSAWRSLLLHGFVRSVAEMSREFASRIPAGPSLPCARLQRARSSRMNLHRLRADWEK